jgi:hypothetical protein
VIRSFAALLAAGLTAVLAQAHFVFIVPAPGGATAAVVLSEELAPDEAVDIGKVGGAKLFVRDAAGKDSPVEHEAGKHALTAALPGSGPRVVYGSVTFGVRQRGGDGPFLLVYHPKAFIGPVPAEGAALGAAVPAELVPAAAGGKVRFKLVAGGKPVPGAEVTVLKPDGSKVKVTTGADGLTEAVEGAGRFGAWARHVEPKAGEFGGKKYAEVRHYPTLVFDAGAPLPPMPAAVSSFGAVACGGYLYAYGGHVGKTHSYDTKAVVGTFHRLKLDGGTKWEQLPGGPILQGMNLAAHGGKVYRVGGMQPRNAPGEPADTHSVAEVARFDPETNKWEAMPPLPAARSSHDVVVVGDKLVVVGGWDQKGKGQKPAWHDTALALDLSAAEPQWKSIPQPFKRRALTAAAVGTRVYVIAGLGEKASGNRVDVLDVATGKWSEGPPIPGERVGFAPAACAAGGRVLVNTGDGSVYRLSAKGDAWEKVGRAEKKRIVARLVPLGAGRAILLGGASAGGNADSLEVIPLPAAQVPTGR